MAPQERSNVYVDEDLQTVELDGYLSPRPPRRLRGEELAERLRWAFDPAEDDRPFAENHPHRVLALWRIARAMARVCGLCAEDETLDGTLSQIEPDPWYLGIKPQLSNIQQNLLRKSTAGTLLEVYARGLVPLLPSPKDPVKTDRWFEIAWVLATDLSIERTDHGARGMQGLHDPKGCQWAKVTPKQVVAVEELLVDEAQRLIIKVGERPAVEQFRQRYGFTRAEALGLMRLARAEALRMDGSTVEENRAIMSSMLKDFVSRAKQAINQRDELAALKELGRVQGLTRTEPEDDAKTFFETIARVAKRQDAALQLGENKPRVVDVRSEEVKRPPVEVEDPEDEDEEEALKDFDREKNL